MVLRLKPLILGLIAALAFQSAASADALNDWRQTAIKQLLSNKTYPRSALAKEIEGRAMVLVQVNANGEIANHRVMQPTGQSSLDREIPKIIQRATPLPKLPSGESSASLVVPLEWSLN